MDNVALFVSLFVSLTNVFYNVRSVSHSIIWNAELLSTFTHLFTPILSLWSYPYYPLKGEKRTATASCKSFCVSWNEDSIRIFILYCIWSGLNTLIGSLHINPGMNSMPIWKLVVVSVSVFLVHDYLLASFHSPIVRSLCRVMSQFT